MSNKVSEAFAMRSIHDIANASQSKMNSRAGFTVLELMMVVILFAILVGAVTYVFVIVLREFSNTDIRSELRQDGVTGIERLARELSQAREITSARGNSVSFWRQDIDGDGVRDSEELITFSWNGTPGTALRQGSANLAYNVENFQISYRDLNNDSLSPSPDLSLVERDSIRRLDVILRLKNADQEITLLTSIIPRNLRQVRGPW